MIALLGLIGLLGLVIGSFLNVVIWRVPRGESVASPPSHCPGCDAAITPRDNIPVFSWLVLRGRCRHCSCRISVRYPLVELLTAVLFVATAARIGVHADLPAYLCLAAVGVALSLIDIDVQRLPDVLTLPSYPVLLALLGIAAGVDDRGDDFVRALVGMVVVLVFYAGVRFAYPAGMGLGDVKLSGIVGLALGWLGWGPLVVGAFAAFVVGAAVSVGVLVFHEGGRKTRVPFGPFMLIGIAIGVAIGHPVAHAYLHTVHG
jgi:leader peptidase (prepilin peptidase)/N-methyltransferase